MSALNPPPAHDPYSTHRTTGAAAFGASTQTRVLPKWVPIVVGSLVVIAGLGLVLWPFFTASSLLVVLFGTALIANGLGVLVRASGFGMRAVAGIVLILAGVLSLVFSEFTVNALVTFVGVSVLLVGVSWLALVAKLSQGARFTVYIAPIVVIVAGIVTLVWPEFSLKVVAVICGFITIVIGASMIWAATRLRPLTPAQHTIIID